MSSSLRLNIDDYEQMIANGAFVGIDRLPSVHGYQDVRKFERHENLSPLCKPDVELSLAELFSEE